MIETATLTSRVWLLLAIVALSVCVALGGAGAWIWQANAYGKDLAKQASGYDKQLADKDTAYSREREAAATAALDQLQLHQEARRVLEDQLQQQETAHYTEMLNAQNDRKRLADRLANADVRLSVLIAAGTGSGASGSNYGLQAAAGASSLVDGPTQAELDPAHAQRSIAITGDGDDGLKALQACQDYVNKISQ